MFRFNLLLIALVVTPVMAADPWATTRYALTTNQSLTEGQITWAPDGKYVTAAGGAIVRIDGGEDLGRFPHLAPIFVSGDRFLATHKDMLGLYSLGAKPEKRPPPDHEPRLRDGETADAVSFIGEASYGRKKFAMSADGKWAVTIDNGNPSYRLTLWDITQKKMVKQALTGQYLEVIAFAPDGKHVVAWHTQDSQLHVWDLVAAKTTPVRNPDSVYSRHNYTLPAFTSDGAYAVDVWRKKNTSGDMVVFTDLKAGTATAVDLPNVASVAFASDGKAAALGFDDGTVRYYADGAAELLAGRMPTRGEFVVDQNTTLTVPSMAAPNYPHAIGVAFSPDGTIIASADRFGALYLSRRGKPLRPAAASEWLPTALGTTWTYRTEHDEIVETVTGHEVVRGVTTLRVTRGSKRGLVPLDGKLWPAGFHRHFEVGAKSIRLRGESGHLDSVWDGFPILPEPSDKEQTINLGNNAGTVTIAAAVVEKVTVPAGTYDATKIVHTISERGNLVGVKTYWFVKGTGVVKRDIAIGNQRIQEELSDFRPTPYPMR